MIIFLGDDCCERRSDGEREVRTTRKQTFVAIDGEVCFAGQSCLSTNRSEGLLQVILDVT